jgi:hypothetical protein
MESKSNRSKPSTRVEKYPLPSGVEAIISLMREIMNEGSVQRIELDVELPVRVVRNVEPGDPLLAEVDIGLKGVLRQVEFIEYYSEGATPFQVVVDMMQLLHKEVRHPICWVTGPSDQEPPLINTWLEWKERGMPAGTDHLLGLPVRTVDDLSEDTLILCGSEYPSAETSEITMAIKTAIEIRSENEREPSEREAHDDPVGLGARQRHPTASQLALSAGGLRRVEWEPPG